MQDLHKICSLLSVERSVRTSRVLLWGPPGSGKRRIVEALETTFHTKLAFHHIDAHEIFAGTFALLTDSEGTVMSGHVYVVYDVEILFPKAGDSTTTGDETDPDGDSSNKELLEDIHARRNFLLQLHRAERKTLFILICRSSADMHAAVRSAMDYEIELGVPGIQERLEYLRSRDGCSSWSSDILNVIANRTGGYTYGELERFVDRHAQVGSSSLLSLLQPKAGNTEIPHILWDAVEGLTSVKSTLQQYVSTTSTGKRQHLLLFGVPGTGKTLLAKAIATSTLSSFHYLSIPDLIQPEVGASEANLNRAFKKVRSQSPSVVFIDEIEAMFPSRDSDSSFDSSRFLSQFFLELDQIDCEDLPITVLGATNAPHHLDKALLRPGRIGMHVHVTPPTSDEIRQYLSKTFPYLSSKDVDTVAEASFRDNGWGGVPFGGYTFADITAMCSVAKLRCVRRLGPTGEVGVLDLVEAIKTTPRSYKTSELRFLNQWKYAA
eukprot:PhF_6_TR32968/c0_g1_i1/m.48521/K13525/VCP, CDC48; transitional endoplasmic reticulum ATPase